MESTQQEIQIGQNSPIKVSDWLNYLSQYASPNLLLGDYLLNYSNYVISVVAVLISIMTYTIVFTPGQIILVGVISFIILILALCLFYMARFLRSIVTARVVNTFSLAILSSQYPHLKTTNEIESKWQRLWYTIRWSHFLERRVLINYNPDEFNNWFDSQ